MNLEIVRMREAIAKVTHLLVGQDVRVTQEGSAAYVQMDAATGRFARINIPMLPDDAGPDLIRATQGFVDHEVGHVLFTDPDVIGEAAQLGIRASHNIIEDLYVEREMESRFPGSRFNLDNLRELLCTDVAPKLLIEAGQDAKRRFGVLVVEAARAMAGQERCRRFMEDGGHWKGKIMRAFVAALGPDVIARIPHLGSSAECLEVARHWAAAMQAARECADAPPGLEQDDAMPLGSEDAGHQARGSSGSPGEDKAEGAGTEPGDGTATDHADGSEGASRSGQDRKASDGEGHEDSGGSPEGGEQSGTEGSGPDAGTGNKHAESSGGASGSDENGSRSPGASEEKRGGDQSNDSGSRGGSGTAGEKPASGSQSASSPGSRGTPGSGGGPSGPFDETDDGDRLVSRGEGVGKSPYGGEPGRDADRGGDPVDAARPTEPDHHAGGHAPSPGMEEPVRDLSGQVVRPGAGASWSNWNASIDPEGMPVDPFAEAIQRAISERVAATASAYRIFTRDNDKIEAPALPSVYDDRWLASLEMMTEGMAGAMRRELERMMAARSRSAFQPGLRSGSLHAGGLYRLALTDDRVFRRKVVAQVKSAAVTLLVDNSGSMQGERMTVAMASAYALATTLERIAIPCEVIGYTTDEKYADDIRAHLPGSRRERLAYSRYAAIRMPVFKPFNERLTPANRQRFAVAAMTQSENLANVDGESLRYAAIRLMRRPEARRIVIVMSDGMPAVYKGNDDELHAHLKKTVSDLIGLGIEVVGIGIMTDAVRRFYPRALVLEKLEDLPGAVMGELRRILSP